MFYHDVFYGARHKPWPKPGKHPRIHRRTTFIIMGSVKQLAIEGPQKYFSNGGGERGR